VLSKEKGKLSRLVTYFQLKKNRDASGFPPQLDSINFFYVQLDSIWS